ncbi:hypothetical protein CEXT_287311 [Caerostris extrusa]|uniref:Uncharacterized protein n=1 Tax=Caerostris extrusa TaxID=172846 RepID=A0AAV4M635_CAEEX|nr:hypothetical protein CEXT_287311 [Caerostris extrusa]
MSEGLTAQDRLLMLLVSPEVALSSRLQLCILRFIRASVERSVGLFAFTVAPFAKALSFSYCSKSSASELDKPIPNRFDISAEPNPKIESSCTTGPQSTPASSEVK